MYADCSTISDVMDGAGVPAPQSGGNAGGLLHRTLSPAHIRPQVMYKLGCSLLKVTKGQDISAVGGGARGRVSGFSRQSRRRLMMTIAGVKRNAELPSFVTLTYPSEFPTVERAKRDLKIFLQRLNRKFPNAGYIWKLEPQERGAPHYHMMVWGVSNSELFGWTVKNWFEIAGNGDKNHYLFHMGVLKDSVPCVSKVRSFRGIWSYASKYLGKTFDVAEWGQKWTGRFWGVGKREFIPFGDECILDVSYNEVVQLMRFQRRFAGIKKGHGNSLTVFCDADQWAQKLELALYARRVQVISS